MQPDQVGIDLPAHAHKGLDHRVADFPPQPPGDLDRRTDRRRLRWRDVGEAEGDQRDDRKGETDSLDQLRDPEIPADPVVSQPAVDPAADRDHREAEHQRSRASMRFSNSTMSGTSTNCGNAIQFKASLICKARNRCMRGKYSGMTREV